MVVLNQFYQIVERKTDRISILWKALHVLLFIILAISGFITSFFFGCVVDEFNYNCVLEANLQFSDKNYLNVTPSEDLNKTEVRAIDLTITTWGHHSVCDFAQFTPIFSMLSAIIWGTFFVILAKGGAGQITDNLSRPWTAIYPCLIFSFIFVIMSAVCRHKLTQGISDFCEQFKFELNSTVCTDLINIYVTQFDSEKIGSDINFYIYQQLAIIGSDISLWGWLLQLFLLILRVCSVTDFDIHHVTVETKEEEQLEHIIDFQDDERHQLQATSKV